MAGATEKVRQRQEAKKEISKLFGSNNVYVVHYACESFFNRLDGTSPRITSIAVSDLQNGQVGSFSIHLVAERQQVKLGAIISRYDDLEKSMLDEFYNFIRQRKGARWVVWNMRDVNYGFPAIAQRYRVLGGDPVDVEGADLFDLAEALLAIYGPKYVKHPHLEGVMRLNAITDRSFMTGGEEAEAFEKQDYVALHQSTLRKVHVIREVARRERNGQLKTNARRRDIYGSRFAAWGEILTENSWVKLVTALSVFWTVGSIIYFFGKFLTGLL